VEQANKLKLAAELDRLTKMDEDQRIVRQLAAPAHSPPSQVYKARMHIVENILTLACPRCNQVFLSSPRSHTPHAGVH
jgi:hypothetical protein